MNSTAGSDTLQPALLKPIWAALLGPPWLVSIIVLIVLIAIRFFAVFSPYPLQALFFLQTVAMWAVPFIFLTASGRRQIGLTERGISAKSLLLSALGGSGCALALFALGMAVYGDSPDNWCISIRNHLRVDEMRGIMSPLGLFALYALPAIFLNPVGEEILFRGFIQRAFAIRFNATIATLVNSLLFGLCYLYLHGIWRDAAGFHIRLVSAALAMVLMALVGAVFTLCRTISGSLWPAMAAHAAFNLTMLAVAIHEFLH
jgi:membrane protease YdiL (CAAX protease family)